MLQINLKEVQSLKPSQILTQNAKMRKTSKENKVRLFNFGITAYKSYSTGKITCPFAKDCVKFCYAKKGAYSWSNVKPAYEKRYLLTKDPVLFKSKINEAIKVKKPTHIRIHDSGDFYNRNYILQWFDVMRENKNILFYAYSKSKMIFDEFDTMPENFTLIYSFGSKFDNLIEIGQDRHAKIFDTLEQMYKEGYINASDNDLQAINTNNNKIGLLIH